MRNVGPKTKQWLTSVGVNTIQDLENIGAVEAYRRIREIYPDLVTLNALWSLQAAVLDIDWRDLPDGLKDQLRTEVDG